MLGAHIIYRNDIMPTRRPYENRKRFMTRCMGDDKMVREFPNNSQRYAVCVKYADKD